MNERLEFAHAVLLVGGRYALQLRDGRTSVWPHTWGFFGGHIEQGESPLVALRREVAEELAMELPDQVLHLLDLAPWTFFAADVTALWPSRRLLEGERDGVFSLDEIERLDLPRNRGVVDVALRAHRDLVERWLPRLAA